MASRERDHNIWKSPGGALFFKLGIPPALREHFKSTTGRPKVKISEPLGTYDPYDARLLRDQKLAHYQRVFARLASGATLSPEEIAAERRRVHRGTLQALLAGLAEPPAPLLPEEERMFEAMRAAVQARRPMIEPAILAELAAEVRRIADEKYGAGTIAEGSDTWKELWTLLASAKAKAIEDHLVGLLRREPPPSTALPVEPPAPTAVPVNGNGNGNLEKFSKALDHYIEWQRDVRKARVATIGDFKSRGERFVKFANDPSLGAVTIDQAKDFLKEVAKDAAPATVNQYHMVCRAVFEHARNERHRFKGENPFSFQERKAIKQSKAKFTVDELNRLFNSPTFIEREIKPKVYNERSALPWASIVALYSGAALEEIAQLRPKDLTIESGIRVINILPEASLSGELKRKSRKRNIPLHPELERLGLLEYLAALPRSSERLFPGLSIHASKNKFSPKLGKAFNEWRRELGIDYEDRQLDFHSLRHCFGKAIEDTGITVTDRARLLGHAVADISSSVYSAPELARVAPLVARVAWPGLCIK